MFRKPADFKSTLHGAKAKRLKERKNEVKMKIQHAADEGMDYVYFYDEFPHELVKAVALDEGLEVTETDHKGIIRVAGW